LLVHVLELLGLALGNVQPHRQVVVVLDQLLDGACAVCQVVRQVLSFLRQLLHHLRDLDSVHGGLAQLVILSEQVAVDAFQLLNVSTQLRNHLVCAFKLLEQAHVFVLLRVALPPQEGSEARLKVIILAQGDREFLTADVVSQ